MNFRQFFTSHAWWGKILGCFFGYLIAGPIGAFFGIIIGNFFDQGLMSHLSKTHWSFFTETDEVVQNFFLKATFSVIGHIAKAEGRVTENYIHMAQNLMAEMSLPKKQRQLAREYFNEGKSRYFNLAQTLQALRALSATNKELLRLFMNIQYQAIQVDGLSTKKLTILDSICKQLGFAPLYQHFRERSYYHRPYTNPNNGLKEAYTLLQVPENASKQEIKKAYRRLISQNHPDKLIAKGLSEAAIKKANDKTQGITKAYEKICRSKGW